MDYSGIHVLGHLLSDDLLHDVEQDVTLQGNHELDFGLTETVASTIDYAWSSLRADWRFYQDRITPQAIARDPYGTRRSRDLMERVFRNLGFDLQRQITNIEAAGKTFDVTYLAPDLGNMPVIVVGDRVGEGADIATKDVCSLDYRAKGERRQRSPHATMLEYLNSTENVYGVIANGRTVRLIRNSGQLVKVTYIEFDLRRIVEEDKYSEFCLMFRLLHASRFRTTGDKPCVMETWFNLSIESGNRIRDGLSKAVQCAMETIGDAILTTPHEPNAELQSRAENEGDAFLNELNGELIHFIYRLLFLFIIEDRDLVYNLPENPNHPDYVRLCRAREIYSRHYAVSRLRSLSELGYLRHDRHHDLWEGLMETFRLFETGNFGAPLAISPLGGVLFDGETLKTIKRCRVENRKLLAAFEALSTFADDSGQRVKINYSALDVEEFGSVYEGILELRPVYTATPRRFQYAQGADRKSTSSYYTRPDLVQNLIRTTLEPVIEEKLAAATTKEEKERALLNLRVCDAACGSGHIVLAMARTIAWYLCTVRTGEDNPASLDYREALREVIRKCVYAVDYNPGAVELCKVVLWIEGYCAGKPLSFLDAHIRCGNSVVGVSSLKQLFDGVPDKALTAENKETLKALKTINRTAVKQLAEESGGLFHIPTAADVQRILANEIERVSSLPENTLDEEQTKAAKWRELVESPHFAGLRLACNIYTAAFYETPTQPEVMEPICDEKGFIDRWEAKGSPDVASSETVLRTLQSVAVEKGETAPVAIKPVGDDFVSRIEARANRLRFFHWCLEFPEIFAGELGTTGFDVMCGNPPWDKIKIEDKKWFAKEGRFDIVDAGTADIRKAAIKNLIVSDPELYARYKASLADAESMSRFLRFSGRFELTAAGDIDLFPLFAELCMRTTRMNWGLVIPTGIAVNDSNKAFFSTLVRENRLISLYDFENREKLFDIDSRFKFCLLTAGRAQSEPRTVKGGFYLTRLDHLLDPARIYTLQTSDFALLNPNTNTCPTFRTSRDAELTAKIYRNSKVLLNEETGENPWNIRFARQFDLSNDSNYFKTYRDMQRLVDEEGFVQEGNCFRKGEEEYVPLYEGKMIYLYNHHYGTWPTDAEQRPNTIDLPPENELKNPESGIIPWYWVPKKEVESRLGRDGNGGFCWKQRSFLAFRDITNATNERTIVLSAITDAVGVGHSATLLFEERGAMTELLLQAMMSSLVFDYAARQKLGGSHASTYIVKQLPVLPPERFTDADKLAIVPRVLKLVYFNHDLDAFAREVWGEMTAEMRVAYAGSDVAEPEPTVWDDAGRAVLQAELDAIFARLYGLTEEEIKYILDPEDVCGVGCINETFRVLKDNELRKFGEYRTKRLVLSAFRSAGN